MQEFMLQRCCQPADPDFNETLTTEVKPASLLTAPLCGGGAPGRGEQLRGSHLVKFGVEGPFHHGGFVLGFLLDVGLQVSDSRGRKRETVIWLLSRNVC